MRYFIYCRKSTESEDRQILSLDSQKAEALRAFGNRPDITIVQTFTESMSAKAPGRPIFSDMMLRIERGDADGIIAWHPDRISRNSIDGGRIIYLLDLKILKDLKFVSFTFENTSNGKLMLHTLLGFSKYYVDALSENVKRGYRAKIEKGWRPGVAPLGYRNDRDAHTIVPDGTHFTTLKRLFEVALTGAHSVRSLLRILTEDWGYRTPVDRRYKGMPLSRTTIYRMLSNPFYAGYFTWNGRLYPGKQEPMISMAEFKRLQGILVRPGTEKPIRQTFPFTGLIRCGSCRCMVTAEHKVNRFGSRYTYYHCTWRITHPKCIVRSVTAQNLESQLATFVAQTGIPDSEHATTVAELQKRSATSTFSTANITQEIGKQIDLIKDQLRTLTDMRMRNLIDDAEFVFRRKTLDLERIALADRQKHVLAQGHWFEPALLLISFRARAVEWFQTGSHETKRLILKTISSNLKMSDRKVSGEAKSPFEHRVEEPCSPYWSEWCMNVRTRFESADPELLEILANVRTITSMVEGVDRMEVPLPSVDDARESSRDREARAA